MSSPGFEGTDDEGVLDPWVEQWIKDNPIQSSPLETLTPEILELARGPWAFPPAREMAEISDSKVDGIPVRIYRPSGPLTGLVPYFHGGGFVIGSIDIMDNVAPRAGLRVVRRRGVGRLPARARTPVPRGDRRL